MVPICSRGCGTLAPCADGCGTLMSCEVGDEHLWHVLMGVALHT